MAKHSPLLVECLEERCVPDGNVTVFKDGLDNLIIQGDGNNNAIRIEPIARTMGLMVSGFSGTNINGGDTPFTAIVAGNPLGSIRINLNAGNDTVVIQNINQSENQLFGDISINFGSGGAGLWVNGVRSFFGRLNVLSGNGSFFARFTNFEFSGPVDLDARQSARAIIQMQVGSTQGEVGQFGRLSIRTGRGQDTITLRGSIQGTPAGQVVPLLITDTFQLDTGLGDDRLHTEYVEMRGATSIRTGAGNDTVNFLENTVVGGLTMVLDSGNDTLTVEGGTFQRGLSILTGGSLPDQDNLFLSGFDVNGNLKILTGNDDDYVLLTGTNIAALPGTTQGGLSLNTGRGQDRVDMVNLNIAKDMLINLGPDNDAISFSYVNVGGKGIVDGSSGADLLSRIALQVPRGLTLLNFNP
jgi:hypothetical protein